MVKLSEIDLPMIFENKLLFSHGFHNNLNIAPEEVTKSLENTNWTDQRNRSLFFSHHNRDAQKWVGRINNPRVVNGELYGDLEIHDADLALKIGPGRAPIGVSAEIRWPTQFPNPTDFSYRGFAMVPNPEVPETMLNFSKAKEEGFNSATLHTPFTNDTTNFSEEEPKEEKEEVQEKEEEIIVKEEDKKTVEELSESTVSTEEKSDDVESDLMSAERGLKIKMENNANNVEEEVKETVEEVVSEEPKEEVKEEVKEEAKADFSAVEAKIEALEAKVNSLTESFAKFSEAAEAEEEEVVEEEVKEEPKEEAVEEEPKEEVKEAEEAVEEVKEEEGEAEADFSQVLAEKIDKLVDVIAKKEASPMSTAEFGAKSVDKNDAVIDRLTKSLSK